MESFIGKFSGLVKGVLTGFDRIVFKGFILPLMSASEVMGFFALVTPLCGVTQSVALCACCPYGINNVDYY